MLNMSIETIYVKVIAKSAHTVDTKNETSECRETDLIMSFALLYEGGHSLQTVLGDLLAMALWWVKFSVQNQG